MESVVEGADRKYKFPVHGWIGIILISVCWPLNWLLPGLRTHILFFPLWLGYCLFVDGLVFIRKGHSLLSRDPARYIMLFLLSAPVWWLFELLNLRTQNWFYVGREWFSDVQYAVLASFSFSTVIPAVFGTAEWIGSFSWVSKFLKKQPTRKDVHIIPYIPAGLLLLALLLLWPKYFFGFLWISLFFIIDPINYQLGFRSLIAGAHRGDWRPVVSLAVGCLIGGFFWEMWNIYAFPKWIYNVPFVGFWHVFEMPVLGYLGYIPFALELFALYHLVFGITGLLDDQFLQISGE
jgi:hypothetical protein